MNEADLCGNVLPDLADHYCVRSSGHVHDPHECGVCGLQWDDEGNLIYPKV